MKRILFIKKTLGGGGAEKLLIDTLKRIDYSKYEVSLLTNDLEGIYFNQIDSHVKILFYNDIFGSFLLRNMFYYIPFLRKPIMQLNRRRAKTVVGDERFDTAVSYLEGHSASVHLGLLGVAKRNVTWVHIDLFKNPWSRRYYASPKEERKFYQSVDEVVFVSEMAKKQFDKYIPIHAGTRVVYNLIDSEEIMVKASEMMVPKTGKVLVAIGRLEPQKRFDRLLRAMSLIRERNDDVSLWILGQGKMRAKLEYLCNELNLQDCVNFLGFIPNPYPFLKAADIYVSSSDTEGYPLVVAEAMCLGKPVVATAVTGSIEMLSNDAGILVPLDEKAIADSCLALLDDDNAREALGKRAEEEADRRFNVPLYMSSFYAALEGD